MEIASTEKNKHQAACLNIVYLLITSRSEINVCIRINRANEQCDKDRCYWESRYRER